MKLKDITIGTRFSITANLLGKSHEAPVECIKLFGQSIKEIKSGNVHSVNLDSEIIKV